MQKKIKQGTTTSMSEYIRITSDPNPTVISINGEPILTFLLEEEPHAEVVNEIDEKLAGGAPVSSYSELEKAGVQTEHRFGESRLSSPAKLEISLTSSEPPLDTPHYSVGDYSAAIQLLDEHKTIQPVVEQLAAFLTSPQTVDITNHVKVFENIATIIRTLNKSEAGSERVSKIQEIYNEIGSQIADTKDEQGNSLGRPFERLSTLQKRDFIEKELKGIGKIFGLLTGNDFIVQEMRQSPKAA